MTAAFLMLLKMVMAFALGVVIYQLVKLLVRGSRW